MNLKLCMLLLTRLMRYIVRQLCSSCVMRESTAQHFLCSASGQSFLLNVKMTINSNLAMCTSVEGSFHRRAHPTALSVRVGALLQWCVNLNTEEEHQSIDQRLLGKPAAVEGSV